MTTTYEQAVLSLEKEIELRQLLVQKLKSLIPQGEEGNGGTFQQMSVPMLKPQSMAQAILQVLSLSPGYYQPKELFQKVQETGIKGKRSSFNAMIYQLTREHKIGKNVQGKYFKLQP